MDDNLTRIKNLIWTICIIICVVIVPVSFIFTLFQKYNGEKATLNFDILMSGGDFSPLSTSSDTEDDVIGVQAGGQDTGVARGELKTLPSLGADADLEYLNNENIKFLVDSTFIGFRSKGILSSNQVWGTESGSMPISSVSTANIMFPNDGSLISCANAAMISKPEVLYIGIGTDGLAQTDESTFLTQYEKLISDILASSPDTIIVCMGLCSITEDYSGPDGLTIINMSDGNDWVQDVCRDTGAYYLDVAENLGDGSGGLRASYTEANGKTLNGTGLGIVLQSVRDHAVPLN